MSQTNRKDLITNRAIWLMLFMSIVITLLLAYIDEGYYNFQWAGDPGSWVAVGFYVGLFFSIQYVMLFLAKKLGTLLHS